jgi:hypothetical protein
MWVGYLILWGLGEWWSGFRWVMLIDYDIMMVIKL